MEISDYLESLHADIYGTALKYDDYLQAISATLKEARSMEENALACELLFKSQYSFLNLLSHLLANNATTGNDLWKIRDGILKVMLEYVTALETNEHFSVYFQEVLTMVYRIISGDTKDTVKSTAFLIFHELLRFGKDDIAKRNVDSQISIEQIIGRFFEAIRVGKSSLGQQVKGHYLHSLGLLSELFPECFDNTSADKLANFLMRALEKQTTKEKEETALLNGVFDGLYHFLMVFPQYIPIIPKEAKSPVCLPVLYGWLKIPFTNFEVQRYGLLLAASKLLARHVVLFQNYIISDLELIMRSLMLGCKHVTNREVRNVSLETTEKILFHIGTVLANHNTPENKQKFGLLWKEFIGADKLDSPEAGLVLRSVRALGCLGKAIAVYAGANEVINLIMLLLQLYENARNLACRDHDESFYRLIELLPRVLTSIAYLLEEVSISDICKDPFFSIRLSHCIGDVCMYYPRFSYKNIRVLVATAVLKLFTVLKRGDDYVSFSTLSTAFIAQCSKITIAPLQNDYIESVVYNPNKAAHIEYMELWLSIFFQETQCKISDTLEVREFLFSAFVSSFLEILSKLNLQICSGEGEKVFIAQVSTDIHPVKPKDYELYLNFIEFTCKFLSKTPHGLLQNVARFGRELIKFSRDNPMLSGFYKLIRVILISCNSQCFFELSNSHINEKFSIIGVHILERSNFGVHLKEYLSELRLLSTQFRDELSLSCLLLLLSSPESFLDISYQIDTLKQLLNIGISYEPAAESALDVLEIWMEKRTDLIDHLQVLLPSLIEYLKPLDISSSKLSIRVVKFLGHIGGKNKGIIAESNSLMAWDIESRIHYRVVWPSVSFTLVLDRLVPILVNLTASANQQTKWTACESLHSIVIYMICENARQTSAVNARISPYRVLYKKLFPVIMKLGIDSDNVPRQLYSTLLKQCIQWFVTNHVSQNDEAEELLDCLCDAVSNDHDTSLRQFAAENIAIFYKRSTKVSKTPFVERILVRTLGLARHPSEFRRLGAALILSQIYSDIRENNEVIGIYLLDLLESMLITLKNIHKDAISAYMTITVQIVIAKLVKIITDVKHKKWLLLLDTKSRSGNDYCNSLSQFCIWLTYELKCATDIYTRQVMNTLSKLSACISGEFVTSLNTWWESALGNSDLNTSVFNEILYVASFAESKSNSSNWIQWFHSLSSRLDIVCWIIQGNFLNSKILTSLISQTNIWVESSEFLRNCTSSSSLLFWENVRQTVNVSEYSELCKCRDIVIIRLFRLLSLLMKSACSIDISIPSLESDGNVTLDITTKISAPKSLIPLLDSNLFELLFRCIFRNDFGTYVKNSLDQLVVFVKILYFNSAYKSSISNAMLNYFKVEAKELLAINLSSLSIDKLLLNVLFYSSCIQGYQMLVESSVGTILENSMGVSLEMFCNYVLNQLVKVKYNFLSSEQSVLLQKLMKLALSCAPSSNKFLDLLSFRNSVVTSDIEVSFWEIHDYSLCMHVLNNFSVMLSDINSAVSRKQEKLISLSDALLNSLKNSRTTLKVTVLNNICEAVSLYPDIFESRNEKLECIWLAILLQLLVLFRASNNGSYTNASFCPTLVLLYESCLNRCQSYIIKEYVIHLLPHMLMLQPLKLPKSFVLGKLSVIIEMSPFPTKSSDFLETSHSVGNSGSVFTEYCSLITALLDALVVTCDSELMRVLLPILSEENHILESQISSSMEILVRKLTSPGKSALTMAFCDSLMDWFVLNSSAKRNTSEVHSRIHASRFFAVKYVSIIISRCYSLQTVSEFFKRNGKLLYETFIVARPTDWIQAEGRLVITGLPDSEVAQNIWLRDQAVVFSLFEISYAKCDSSANISNTGIVSKNLIKYLISWQSRAGYLCNSSVWKTVHTAAFSALVSCIICTQEAAKLETIYAIFFSEKEASKQVLWDHLVDKNDDLKFEVETNWRMGDLENRPLVGQVNALDNSEDIVTAKYFSDTSLSSSLFMDETLTIDDSLSADDSTVNKPEGTVIFPSENSGTELDIINSNPSMKFMIKLIKYLSTKYQTNTISCWMQHLIEKLVSDSVSSNVKWFIIKIILNEPHIFVRWASELFVPIVKFVVSFMNATRNYEMNYMLRDLVLLFCDEWKGFCPDSLAHNSASDFVSLILKCVPSVVAAVFKSNISLIELLLSTWPSVRNVSRVDIFKMFMEVSSIKAQNSDKQKDIIRGLLLYQSIVKVGFLSFDINLDKGYSFDQVFSRLLDFMSEDRKSLYCVAASCLGLLLNGYDKSNQLTPKYVNLIMDRLSKVMTVKPERYVRLLLEIGLNFSAIFFHDSINKLIFLLLSLKDEASIIQASQILCTYSAIISKESFSDEIQFLLTDSRACTSRIFNLKYDIAHEAILKMWLNLIKFILSSTVDLECLIINTLKCVDSNIESLREISFSLLMLAYQRVLEVNASDSEEKFSSAMSTEIMCKLLTFMGDKSVKIQIPAFEYWNKFVGSDMYSRTESLFKNLYSISCEKSWANYGTRLLLGPLKNTAFFTEKISTSSLNTNDTNDIQFDDMEIDLKSGIINSMVPLFAEQSKQVVETKKSVSLANSVWTKSFTVSNTQADTLKNTQLMSMNETDMSDIPMGSMAADFDALSQFAAGKFSVDFNIQFAVGIDPNQEKDNPVRSVSLKRRFVKSKSYGKYFNESTIKNRTKTLSKNIAAKRESYLIRKYRKGELPDIQISNKDILCPLENLLSEPQIAKEIFIMLFEGLYSSCKDESSLLSIGIAVAKLIDQTSLRTSVDPVFVSILFSICKPCLPIMLSHKLLTLFGFHVATVSFHSKSFLEGIVLLESILNINGSPRIDSAERKSIISYLSQMQRNIGENDLSICLQKQVSTDTRSLLAFQYILNSDVQKAYNLFNDCVESVEDTRDVNANELELWEDMIWECNARLGKWDTLNKDILHQVDGNPIQIWEQSEPNLTNYLRNFLDCGLYYSSRKKSEEFALFSQFIETSLSNLAQKQILEAEYSVELAFYFAGVSQAKCNYYVSKSINNFLHLWYSTSNLLPAVKKSCLLQLQQIVEIDEFCKLKWQDHSSKNLEMKTNLFSIWNSRFPSLSDSFVTSWNRVCFGRQVWCTDRDIQNSDSTSCLLFTLARSAEAASALKNHYLAISLVNKCIIVSSELKNRTELCSSRRLEILKQSIMYSASVDDEESSTSTKISAFKEMFEKLQVIAKPSNDDLCTANFAERKDLVRSVYSLRNLESKILESWGEILESHPSEVKPKFSKTSSECFELVGKVLEQNVNMLVHTGNAIFKESFGTNNTIFGVMEPLSEEQMRAESSFDFAVYSLNRFDKSRSEKHPSSSYSDYELNLASTVIRQFALSLRFSNSRAIIYIPKMIELAAVDANLAKTFSEEMAVGIPCWIYLRWIPQLLAFLGQNELTQSVVINPLLELARTYPQAIFFPYQITTNELKENISAQKYLKKIEDSLRGNEHLLGFTDVLKLMTLPHQIFIDLFTNRFLNSISSESDILLVKEKYADFSKLALSENRGGIIGDKIGKISRRFIAIYKQQVVKVFGAAGEKINLKNWTKLCKEITTLREDMDCKHKEILSCSTEDISEYLSRFEQFISKFPDKQVHVPGQYDGLTRPNLDLIVRIRGCSPHISIMSSLRRPKVIIFLGDDEHEYKFLVKGGEDLRLDQRVEQLYGSMNDIFSRDPECLKRNLSLFCYQVVPLTSAIGLVSWVSNSMTLKSILEVDEKLKMSEKISKLKEKWNSEIHKKLYGNLNSFKNAKVLFLDGLKHKKFTRTDVVSFFESFEKDMDDSVLRNGLLKMSASSESFLTVRIRFSSSFSTLSVANYILGIGDRHLDNFIFLKDRGICAGIDFGAAFGYAQNLPVPELMPIRLTKQLRCVTSPISGVSLFKIYMSLCMSALRKQRRSITPVLAVFINEPTADWVAASMMLKLDELFDSNSNGNQAINSGIPESAIFLSSRFNSAHVMVQEMEWTSSTHNDKDYFSDIKKVIFGPADSLRSKLSIKTPLSVSDQIDVLIEHSTDSEILGRTFVGWGSFL